MLERSPILRRHGWARAGGRYHIADTADSGYFEIEGEQTDEVGIVCGIFDWWGVSFAPQIFDVLTP